RLFAQVEPADFGADMFAERNDVEPGSGHHRHGGSSAVIGDLAPNPHSAGTGAAAWCAALPCSTSPLAKAARIFATSPRPGAAPVPTATASRPPSASLMKSMPSA